MRLPSHRQIRQLECVVAHHPSGFFALAAAPRQPLAVTTLPTSPRKTRVRGFRHYPSGRLSRRSRGRSMFTPGSRRCAYKTVSGRHEWLNRDPIGERGELNLYAYVRNNPINLFDPLGLYDYSAAETQQQFLGPALASATAGPIQGLLNIKHNSQGLGPYDFGWNQHKHDTFCVNGKRLTADQFGNYIAGYQGAAYDQYVTSPYPALATVYADGLYYHIMGDTKAVNDPFDTTGFPYIHMGAQGVPAPPQPQTPSYQNSPAYQYGF